MITSLANFLRPPKHEHRAIVVLAQIVTALAFWLLTFTIYKSYYSPKPIELLNTDLLVHQVPYANATALFETRVFKGNSETSINAVRRMYIEKDPAKSVLLESGMFNSLLGEFTVSSVTALPGMMQGRWCLETRYIWWPDWSQTQFEMRTPDVCFNVVDNEGSIERF